MKPKLTFGMACYDDPIRVVATVQNFQLNHGRSDTEVLVVDNKPDAKGSGELRKVLREFGARYFPMKDQVGTSGPRQRVFDLAQGEYVLCVDAHVFLAPGSVARLIDWYDAHPNCNDLITGPLLRNNRQVLATHYNPGWRTEMFGKWGQAWLAPNGDVVSPVNDRGELLLVEVATGEPWKCAYQIEGHRGHEQRLLDAGFQPLGIGDDDEFVINGMGLGLFSCRRKSWVGFHPGFRGFGGAEQYIHAKFRKGGNCSRNLSFLKWWHDWSKFQAPKYPIRLGDKLANVIIGRAELGESLDDAREHFVDERGCLSRENWDQLAADPLNTVVTKLPNLNDLYVKIKAAPGPINKHMDTLKQLAEQVDTITEFSDSKASLAALALGVRPTKGRSPRLVSWNTDDTSEVARFTPWASLLSEQPDKIERTELLFISGGKKTADELDKELYAYTPQVTRWIAMHGVASSPELMPVARMFFRERKDWFVAHTNSVQGGLTLMGRLERDRPGAELFAWDLGGGPGTELKAMLLTIGIAVAEACDCNRKARQMDAWGVEGCIENRETIIKWMREGHARWKWTDKIAAAAKAVSSGLAFRLKPLDPFPSLIDEAIRRAADSIASKQATA